MAPYRLGFDFTAKVRRFTAVVVGTLSIMSTIK